MYLVSTVPQFSDEKFSGMKWNWRLWLVSLNSIYITIMCCHTKNGGLNNAQSCIPSDGCWNILVYIVFSMDWNFFTALDGNTCTRHVNTSKRPVGHTIFSRAYRARAQSVIFPRAPNIIRNVVSTRGFPYFAICLVCVFIAVPCLARCSESTSC